MKKFIKKILILLIIAILFIIYFISLGKERGIRVVNWDNYYDGNSIEIFYEPIRKELGVNEKLEKFERTYKVNTIVSSEKTEINKILKICEILYTIVDPDDIYKTKYLNGYDILLSKGDNKKVSERDAAIILRDLLLTIGYESRIGVFRKESPQFENNSEYYVVEYWSPEKNKWIMVDFIDKSIPMFKEEPLGSVELVGMKGLGNIEFINIKGEEIDGKIREIKKYISSYSIPIDNTLSRKRSNSCITYVSSDRDVDFISNDMFLPPTIYTKNKELFDQSPFSRKKYNDEKAYLIFMKKIPSEKSENDENNKYEFIIDSFKNGTTIKEYYLNINNAGFEKVHDHKEYILKEGINKIELSLGGKNIISSVEIIRDKV